jgi:hypothetical protein
MRGVLVSTSIVGNDTMVANDKAQQPTRGHGADNLTQLNRVLRLLQLVVRRDRPVTPSLDQLNNALNN